MFDLENLEAGVPLTVAGNLLLARPLEQHHISVIKQYFACHANSSHWCGYTLLENVPEPLRRTVMYDATSKDLGVILFSETPDHVRFIFRDIHDTFRLLNSEGHTIYMTDNLEPVLERFVGCRPC